MFRAVKTITGWLIFTLIGSWLLRKIPAKLAENAITGWADNAIGDALGITAPQANVIIAFLWEWAVPAAAAGLAVWLWHLWYTETLSLKSYEINLWRRSVIIPAILTAVLFVAFAASAVWLYRTAIASAGVQEKAVRIAPFFFAPHIHTETRSIKSADGKDTELYENTYYLGVGNDEPSGKNLRRVQVRLFGYDLATQTTLLGADTISETDIRHGEIIYFKVGRVVSKRFGELPKGSVIVSDKENEMYVHNIGLGGASFEIWNTEQKRQFGLHNRQMPDGPPSVWPLGALITADDTKSVQLALKIDFGNEKSLVSISGENSNQ